MRVLVCGDRNWTDPARLGRVLDALHPNVIIEGEARGADTMARNWGIDHIGRRNIKKFPAKWTEYGRAAGPIRNQQMLDEGQPDLVVAFHDDFEHSKGTKDMVQRARAAQLPVLLIGPGNAWIALGNRERYSMSVAIEALTAMSDRQTNAPAAE